MSDSEPPEGDGQSQQVQHRNGGSLARLRNLLRLLRRPALRGPEAAMEALRGVEEIGIVRFTEKDVERHKLVARIVGAYEVRDRALRGGEEQG